MRTHRSSQDRTQAIDEELLPPVTNIRCSNLFSLFFAGENDTTLHNKNSKVIDVSSEAGVVRKYNASTLEYLRPSNEDEHTLANTCMHVDASGRINIGRKKKQVQAQNQIRFISEFDMRTMVQEIKREKYEIKASIECYSVLIVGGKIHSVHATKNYGYLLEDIKGVKGRFKEGFVFLFLPRKEHIPEGYVRGHLSLKDLGWGPPTVKINTWCLLPRCKRQLIKYSMESRIDYSLSFLFTCV